MQLSAQKSKINADKKRKSTFEDDSYRPERNLPGISTIFRFWIHVDSAERLRKTSMCYKQQGIGQ